MANRYLVDIGMNDPLPDVIRKTNRNFRMISSTQTKQGRQELRENVEVIDSALSDEIQARQEADYLIGESIGDIQDDITAIYGDLANSMNYMGQKQTAAQLPSAPKLGDVWTIVQASNYGAAGTNVVWDGIQWLALGVGGGGGGGTSNYNDLTNKPSIEMVVLQGNKTFPDLGIFIDPDEPYPQSDNYALTNVEITNLWNAS